MIPDPQPLTLLPVANKKRLPVAKTVSVVPPELPTGPMASPAVVPAPDTPTLSKAAQTLADLGFCPITEMVKMYRENKCLVPTRDGSLIEADLDPASRIKILAELGGYAHAKSKPTDPKIQGTVINLTINKF